MSLSKMLRIAPLFVCLCVFFFSQTKSYSNYLPRTLLNARQSPQFLLLVNHTQHQTNNQESPSAAAVLLGIELTPYPAGIVLRPEIRVHNPARTKHDLKASVFVRCVVCARYPLYHIRPACAFIHMLLRVH